MDREPDKTTWYSFRDSLNGRSPRRSPRRSLNIIDMAIERGEHVIGSRDLVVPRRAPLKVLWCHELAIFLSSLLDQERIIDCCCLLCASIIVLSLGCALEVVLEWNLTLPLDLTAHRPRYGGVEWRHCFTGSVD